MPGIVGPSIFVDIPQSWTLELSAANLIFKNQTTISFSTGVTE
jgi:hypothetical protein